MAQTFDNFADLARAMGQPTVADKKAQRRKRDDAERKRARAMREEYESCREDRERAARLRRVRHLPGPKVGPKVAR